MTTHKLERTVLEDLVGVAWHDAPLPRRRHRCRAQSHGFIRTFTRIERCAYGGVNLNGAGWVDRNSRRDGLSARPSPFSSSSSSPSPPPTSSAA